MMPATARPPTLTIVTVTATWVARSLRRDSIYADALRRRGVDFDLAFEQMALAALRAEGCQVDDKVDESEYGKFGWVVDPDGNKIELWEPPAGQ